MLQRSKGIKALMAILLGSVFAASFSCTPKESYEGVYRVEGEVSRNNARTQIELREKGIGVWRVHDDEAPFRWDVKNSEIWFSTKLGGIIIGKIRGGLIEITLPGSKTMSFKKDV